MKHLADEVEKLETVTTEPLASTANKLEIIISNFKALYTVRCDVSEVTVRFVRTQALRHCTGASRFSYSTPLTTCAWTTVLYALREVATL